MSRRYASALGLSTALLAGCAEGELEDPPAQQQPTLVGFQESGCKKLETAQSVLGVNRQSLVSIPDYEGLECVEWELTADPRLLVLRLLNFNHDCVSDWEGRVERGAGGEIDFILENAQCEVESCGPCLFDLKFEIEDFTYAGGLSLRVGSAACTSDEPNSWQERLDLPLEQEPSGILCRYADGVALDEYAVATDRCGSLRMPCGEGSLCSSGADTGCESGLDCALLGGSDVSRCLATCEMDDDCEPSAILACIDGLCQLH